LLTKTRNWAEKNDRRPLADRGLVLGSRPVKLRYLAALLATISCGSERESAAPATSREELMDPATCASCHDQHYREWSGSMHAYAAEDPLFLAMNRRAQRDAGLGDFCVKCHAPMAVRTGATTNGLNLDSLPAAQKGVTCYFCHAVDDVQGAHDNPLHLADDQVMRGRFADPVPNSVHRSGYSALHDRDQLASASLCGACHDIVNGHGVELERTFAEWRETVFSTPEIGTTCGQCHMDQSPSLKPAARVPGLPVRRLHDHSFPGVDLALTEFPEGEAQRAGVEASLNDTLQSALCVRGVGAGAKVQVILDNVAAGHRFPSGATQDRRAWVELRVEAEDGSSLYQSGVVPEGVPVTALEDPDLWLFRDCLRDEAGKETHMFWEAAKNASNQLPGQLTFDASDPRFYKTHVFASYPELGPALSAFPSRVAMRVKLEAFGLDVLDDLARSADLTGDEASALAAKIPRFTLGSELVWSAETANLQYLDSGIPVSCISTTNLNARADKVKAQRQASCAP
jgi:hypothetical protein